jgi:hypothetical protein
VLTARARDFECSKQTTDEGLAMVLRIERSYMFVEAKLSINASRTVNISGVDLDGDKAGISFLASARRIVKTKSIAERT